MSTIYEFPKAQVNVTLWKYVMKSCQPCPTLNTSKVNKNGMFDVYLIRFYVYANPFCCTK